MGLRELCPLASVGPVVLEEQMFENADNTHTHTYIRTGDKGLPIL